MLLAFIMGAFVARFDDVITMLHKDKQSYGIIKNDIEELDELVQMEQKLERKRMEQFFNAMNWNGSFKEDIDEE